METPASMRGPSPEASGEAIGPEGDDSNMGTAPTSGPEATSSQGKFTPGPWHVDSVMGEDPHEICATNPRTGAGNPEVIATVFHDPYRKGTISLTEANANARLIAEAPAMFAALRALLATSDLNFDSLEPDTVRAIQAARAVMAKVSA